MVIAIPAQERGVLWPLFEANRRDAVLIRTVLEGHYGVAQADSRSDPTVARLDAGGFAMLGGDPGAAAATALLHERPIFYVTPETSAWEAVLRAEHGDRLTALRFTECSPALLQADHLERLVRRLPAGFELTRIDAGLVPRVGADLGHPYFFECFHSADDFQRRGLGYCILHQGKVVSAAASMAACDSAIEVEILTDAAYRRRSLGTCVGAQLALVCLERGLRPEWVAGNPTSLRLARRLGYEAGDTYETFLVRR